MATANMHTILIVGGTSGIGLAFARRFHSKGKTVIITGRRRDRLSQLATEGLQTYPLDFGNLETLSGEVDAIFGKWPDIDTVFLNAGLQYASDIKDLTSSADAKVIEEVNVNVTAPMIFARHAVPKLLHRGDDKPGTLMFNSSGLGFLPVGTLFPVYCATKSAIHYYAVGLRQALKGTSVGVVEIVPPFVGDTELGMEHRELVKGATPMPMGEFEDAVFVILDGTEVEQLKEVSAGTGVDRVRAWRDGVGKVLEKGLGG